MCISTQVESFLVLQSQVLVFDFKVTAVTLAGSWPKITDYFFLFVCLLLGRRREFGDHLSRTAKAGAGCLFREYCRLTFL